MDHHNHSHPQKHDRSHPHKHSHTHGMIDASIPTTELGIKAIKWSFSILMLTAVLQLYVVFISGSVALLADTIHNFGDASTAIPLWIAFRLSRLKPTKRFTYGLARAEDLAGQIIVAVILFSAVIAAYESIDRLINPKTITNLQIIAIAAFIGFAGNEAAAQIRIKSGRKINSAALIADGYHARIDGFTSLAVLLGAGGVWLGYPAADPLIGLIITIAILRIVWQSAKMVFVRILDGVEPGIIDEIKDIASGIDGVQEIKETRARWVGHHLFVEMYISFSSSFTAAELSNDIEHITAHIKEHIPYVRSVTITPLP